MKSKLKIRLAFSVFIIILFYFFLKDHLVWPWLLRKLSCFQSILKGSKESFWILICKNQKTAIYERHILNQLSVTKKLLLDTVIDWIVSYQPYQNVFNDVLIIKFSNISTGKEHKFLKEKGLGNTLTKDAIGKIVLCGTSLTDLSNAFDCIIYIKVS